ncbi:hypothetical protein EB061_07985 [bacterium]|nr:hypothetical protein [bacterium]
MTRFTTAIIGGGLSGFLHARALLANPDPRLKLAMIDPDSMSLSKKTYSSWRRRDRSPHPFTHLVAQPVEKLAEQLVEQQWHQFQIFSPEGGCLQRRFDDYVYERIPGSKILTHLEQQFAHDSRLVRLADTAEQVIPSDAQADNLARIDLGSGRSIWSKEVLSSVASVPRNSMIQYFIGFEIETERDSFDPATVTLMDFRVPQEGDVRFIYILPFSKRSALVEFTVFSNLRLPDSECEHLLKDHLSNRLRIDSYRVVSRETGDIPMSTEVRPRFPSPFGSSRIHSIGTAAGRIKPSTGYSFQRNCRALNPGNRAAPLARRFQLYDKILLGVLRQKGTLGAEVFCRLFERNPPSRVFSFLDEESGLMDEVRIFLTLPWRPFFRQLLLQHPFFFGTLATGLCHLSGVTGAVWLIPLSGLITVGIGHGSIDHLMSPKSDRDSIFLTRYLIKLSTFLLFFLLTPSLALIFFVVQSADHFGEGQWYRAIRFSGNQTRVRLLSCTWGLFAFLFGVLFHWEESLPILESITGRTDFFGLVSLSQARMASFVLLSLALFIAHRLNHYVARNSGFHHLGFLSTLGLAVGLGALPLLPGFLCFFVFWHSWDSVRFQQSNLGLSASQYLKSALPWTAVSILGAIAWMWFTKSWEILFYLVGALTAAHAPEMSRFYRES